MKKLTKKLSLEPSGVITIHWETEEGRENFNLSDVNQIIWSDISQTSNPSVTFTFKDDKKNSPIEVLFEHEEACKQFLTRAKEID